MKNSCKLVLAAAGLLSGCFEASAQQALGSSINIVSPEIHEDSTVTFRLFAPAARSVEITADFLEPQQISTPMGQFDVPGVARLTQQDNGLWEFTSDALSPELYSYSFIVDSLKVNDPSNVYLVRDIGSLTNIFILPGEESELYSVHDVPHGTVSKVWYESPALEMKRRMTIYTPAGYEADSRSYPVLYLLHGMGGDEEAWPSLGRATQILDNLIAGGLAEPMIVVMPNGNASQEAAPGETHLGLLPPTTALPKTMDGSFEAAFPEIVSYVDSHYRTIPDKAHRAIAGLSMGGFHALHISKEYPEMFDYIGLFSSAILPRQDAGSGVYADFDSKLAAQFALSPKLYWIGIGNKDFLYDANTSFRTKLTDAGYPYTYVETDGGHIWKNWRIYLGKFASQLFK